MRFYNTQHPFNCGIDLHARMIYVCILDPSGEVLVHRNMKTDPEAFLRALAPYRPDIVVAVECMFTWYWLVDLCADEESPFVLGHALSMKAIHGGKAKHDQIDSQKMAVLLRGGLLPQAYVYPAERRATRDLLRRRMHLAHKRGELLAHGQNTNRQYHLPAIGQNIAYQANRDGVAERFADPAGQKRIEVDLSLLGYAGSSRRTEMPGQMGEKACKGKDLSIFAPKLARAVYDMLKRKVALDKKRFLNDSGRGVGELDA